MKKSTFRTYYNSKSVKTVNAIIKSEALSVIWMRIEDTLGDSIIEAKGSAEEIKVLRDIYQMVA